MDRQSTLTLKCSDLVPTGTDDEGQPKDLSARGLTPLALADAIEVQRH